MELLRGLSRLLIRAPTPRKVAALALAGICAAVVTIAVLTLLKPPVTIELIDCVDHLGHPSLRVRFNNEKWPVTFRVFDEKGVKLDEVRAFEGERGVYLKIGGYHENIVGARSFTVVAYIGDDAVLKREVKLIAGLGVRSSAST